MGEHGKEDSLALGCILRNTFNFYRDIKEVADVDYDYHSCCVKLADELYIQGTDLKHSH